MSSVRRLAACLALALAGLSLAAARAQAASTLYVQTPANGGSDSHDCTKAEPCATISHAVAGAAEGDTISVGAGSFVEAGSVVRVYGSLTIEGADGAAGTVVEGEGADSIALTIEEGAHVSLSRLTVENPASGGDGVYDYNGSATIADSTISANRGNGVTLVDASATIADSTIAANGASGISSVGGSATVLNSTISANGEYGVFGASGASTTLAASVLAANTKGDCSGAVTDAGYNVDSDGSCGLSASTSISDSPSIGLGPLQENGGPTETEAPEVMIGREGSGNSLLEKIPAGATASIGGKAVALCAGTSDQRGVPRPSLTGASCAIGAVELAASKTTLSASPSSAAAGEAVTLTATVESALGSPVLRAPTGDVSFALEGGAPISGCEYVELKTVKGAQQATCKTTTLPAGSEELSASYEEETNETNSYRPSQDEIPYSVTQPASATLYVASTGSDSANTTCAKAQPCKTIAHAVSVAAGGDTISVGAGTFKEDVTLDRALSIEGAGAGSPTIVEGSGEFSAAITVEANVHATLSHLAVEDSKGDGVESGREASTTITASTISDNSGEGVSSYGVTTITASTISDNSGEGVSSYGVTTITASTISDNREGVVGGEGTITITASTIADNAINGVWIDRASTITNITDSTIAGNGGNGVVAEGATNIIASTIAGNGGGVASNEHAATTLAATIVAASTREDCSGAIVDAGYNVDSDGTCGLSASTSISDSPYIGLGPLQDNGGATETELPESESVAVERIPAGASASIGGKAVALCEGADQRGVPRPSLAGGRCAIGAVELAASKTTLSASPAGAAAGEAVTLTATVAAALGSPVLPAPTGDVAFALVGGGEVSGCENVALATVGGKQQATCTTSALPAGTDELSATYYESDGYRTSGGGTSYTVTQPATATLYVASTGSDANPCTEAATCKTISHAISVAGGGDTISVGAGTFKEDVTVDRALSIEGTNSGTPTTVEGSGEFSAAITVDANVHATLSHLAVEDPSGQDSGVQGEEAATTTISDSTISDSSFGVGVSHRGATTITASTISHNSEIGVADEGGSATIAGSTIAGNETGVFSAYGASATIRDSTIAENRFSGVIDFDSGATAIIDSTIANDEYGVQDENEGTATLAGSIVAGASQGGCFGAVLDAGYNIDSDGSCELSASTSISHSDDIDLGPLSENGGPTETELPGSESVAVERIPAGASASIGGTPVALCEGTSDQRGVARPSPAGGRCDVGAVELAGSDTTLSASPSAPAAGQAVTLTATVASAIGAPALPAPPAGSVSFASGGVAIGGCEAVAVSAAGGAQQATCTTAALPAGTDALTASYRPSASYHPSAGTLSLTVAAPGSGSSGSGGSGSGGVAGFHTGGASSVPIVALSGLRLAPTVFAAADSGPSATATIKHTSKKRKPEPGATVSFTLSQAGTVRFEVTRSVAGRLTRAGRCVAQTRANRRARRCARTVTLPGSFTRAAEKGVNSFRFSARLAGRKLAPGRYILLATPSADGHSGQPHRIAFSIVG